MPKSKSLSVQNVTLRELTTADQDKLTQFIATLPEHDILYVPRDITNPKVIQAWIDAEEEGGMITTLAIKDGSIIGTASLVRDVRSWSPHVAEIRVLVGVGFRRMGLGRALIEDCTNRAVQLGVGKVSAHMTVDQKSAFAIFEALGFKAEALLKNHVRDKAGVTHDIAIMAHHLNEAKAAS